MNFGITKKEEAKLIKKDALVAARELFSVEFFKSREDCEDLAMFGEDVLNQINEIPLPEENISAYKKAVSLLMDKAINLFPWNDARLDLVPDVK